MIESIGPYRVLAKLGEGGMGEVYRARDTKLDRDVAIKVLPEQFVSDPERIARFQREAKTLASLNHPNIGGIYGLEDASGVKALVLELVDGPTLADIIEGSRLRAQGKRLKGRADFRSTKPLRSRGRSSTRSKRRTNKASSTAISSPRTSSCVPTAP